jgi:hypothetical protein
MIVKILVIIMGYILMGIMTAACMKHSTKRDMIMAAAGWPIIWVISAIAFPLFWIFEWFDWLTDWMTDGWMKFEEKKSKRK